MTAPVRRRDADPRARLAEAVAAPLSEGTIRVVTVPAPLARLETLLEHRPEAPAILWDPRGGAGVAGLGEALHLEVRGERRIAELGARAREVFSRLECWGDADAPAPRLYGGLAFAPGSADADPWRTFGDGRFVLPRWRYLRTGSRAYLTLARTADVDPEACAAEADALLAALEADRPVPPHGIWAAEVSRPGPEVFAGLVEAIRAGIAEGRFAKVVAALKGEVALPVDVSPADVLGRLAAEHPDCFRFAFRLGARTFLGATPERLVARRGSRVDADALAGSIAVPPGSPGAKEAARAALLASGKDRGEQQIVVDALRSALSERCTALTVPDAPKVLTLRHVMHLHTPLTGVLRAPTHVLDLVAAIHPTPAVGGVPTGEAVAWITESEPDPRGWYAGPVGWFDAEGDGEFAVAIRSGVLEARRAHVYAGAGIVAASDPASEYAETAVKQRAILRALGIVA